MQNKAAIIILTIALVLVSIYQLSFTGATYKVKKDAKEYAKGDLVKETNYIDSIASLTKDQWSFIGKTYKECQKKEINLGLDLKGGMNVILDISIEDILKTLSSHSTNKTFLDALARANELQKQSQADYLTLFRRAFEEIGPNQKLYAIFYQAPEMKARNIKFNSTNDEVMKALDAEVTIAIDNAFSILRERIDRFGVVQPTITKLSIKGRILIDLPGQKDSKRVRELLQGTANLEFWETYENSEVIGALDQADKLLRAMQVNKERTDTVKTKTADQKTSADTTTMTDKALLELIKKDTTATAQPSSRDELALQNPLWSILSPRVDKQGQPYPSCMVGLAKGTDTAKVNSYLKMKQIRAIFAAQKIKVMINNQVVERPMSNIKFYWSQNPHKYDITKTSYELHAINIGNGIPKLTGDAISSARTSTGITGSEVNVNFNMTRNGAEIWRTMTKQAIENKGGANELHRCIAVVLDGYVRSYPRVVNEISAGNTEITGDFTIEEATDLANILKSGKMPAPARIESYTIVGPTLGKEAINSGFISFVIAFALVLAFMIFYYSKSAGTIADIALITNVFLLFGVLASLGAVLTLPGIAGMVLTMGMAVDANVLIYERIREELRAGKGIKLAISEGYSRAYSAIIDSNVTTILTGIVLYIFGRGPIKGFATTLVIGILTSMFTAIFITRLIYDSLLKKNADLKFSIKITANVFKNTKIDFIGMRKYFYIGSAAILLAGVISLFVRGLNPGIDFTGGRTFVVRFDKPVITADIAARLNQSFGELPQVVIFGSDNQVKITTKYKINETGVADEVNTKLYEGLKSFLSDNVSKEDFLDNYMKSSETVGPVVAADIKINAIYAIGISLVLMFLYIFMRFRYWQYGFGAVMSLAHDTLLVIGVYSIFWGIMPFSMEIDQAFIAAILTIIGFSINDTVIVFDRLREYIPLYRKRPLREVLNMAINSTLSRTINTTLTVILTIVAMFIFGGAVIRGFMFALLVGIGTGVYSSVFVATALMYDTIKKKGDEPEEAKVAVKA
ncbi:MAG: protein translocase subunit SecDF [Bacteroidia bacterium]|jgi:SecD/SecF fusion protein|nr:protein translocase subunit SecDF [Bacteroidia bacterium]